MALGYGKKTAGQGHEKGRSNERGRKKKSVEETTSDRSVLKEKGGK